MSQTHTRKLQTHGNRAGKDSSMTRNMKPIPKVYNRSCNGWKVCPGCNRKKMCCSFREGGNGKERSYCNVCRFLRNVHPGNGTHYTNNKVYLKYGIAINGVSPQPKNTMARMQAVVT
jgi:hypothetical protein